MTPETNPLALYVHFPWCLRKCPYCDFTSFALPNGRADFSPYLKALEDELSSESALAQGRVLASIYLGGGTPSLLSAREVGKLLETVSKLFTLAPDCEISMEANPGTVEKGRLAAFASAGVNRLSLGVQSFSDANLGALGRIHDAREALLAAEEARKAFANFNLDVMFGLPGEDLAALETDIRTALALQSSHLSFYELTIEEGTVFGKRPPRNLPDEDTLAAMQEAVVSELEEAGFVHYEVSGYARPGFACRHNLAYWTFGDYLAAGAGAHAKLTANRDGLVVSRSVRPSQPAAYMQNPHAPWTQVSARDLPFEFMLNALRLSRGVPADSFEKRTGLPLSAIQAPLDEAKRLGLMDPDPRRLAATPLGLRYLSDLQALFL